MQLLFDQLESRAKRLRTVEITLQSLLAYLIAVSVIGVLTWAYVVVRLMPQFSGLVTWDQREEWLTLLLVPAQFTLLNALGGFLLFWVGRATLFLGSASYILAIGALLLFLTAQLVMGTLSAVEIASIRETANPWSLVTGLSMLYLTVLLLSAVTAISGLHRLSATSCARRRGFLCSDGVAFGA